MTTPVINHLSNKFILALMDNCEVINRANISPQQKVDNFKTLWSQLDGWALKGE
ncbi:hypothetical protein [Weissella viridescens]|uniref:hypothetical protein n=1 Tax=Weissella viridescens TaxID=1629 RepID=UPI003AF2FD39